MSKQRVIVEAVLSGKSQREAARLYGISQPRVSQLVAAWRAGGWDAIEPRSRRPHSNSRATPSDMIDAICSLRRQLVTDGCDAGPHSIAALLSRDGRTPPAPSTIRSILTKAGLVTPEPRKRPKHAYLRFEADLPNECWQADFTHWPLADGTDTEILLWLDDHSRYLLSATAHTPVTGRIVLDAFRAACTVHGMPQSTLTDNGFVFIICHCGGLNVFEIELLNLGVAQKNGTPNHPQTQGKVERLNQTLKRWLAARPPAATLPDLQAQLDTFTDYYNTARPHRSLNRRTPAEAYTARTKATPDHNTGGHFRIRDRLGPRQRLDHPAPRRTPAPHRHGRRPRRHPRPHAHPRPARHRHPPRHRRNPPRTSPRPHQRPPAPRTQTRTQERLTTPRRHAEGLHLPTPKIRMTRDIR